MINRTNITEKEFNDIKNTLNSLISANNTLQRIIEVFNTDPIIKEYFDKAEEEVLESGNQSLASMMCIALENMAYDIKDYRKYEVSDEAGIIEHLKAENTHLREKYNKLKTLTNRIYGEIGKNIESE